MADRALPPTDSAPPETLQPRELSSSVDESSKVMLHVSSGGGDSNPDPSDQVETSLTCNGTLSSVTELQDETNVMASRNEEERRAEDRVQVVEGCKMLCNEEKVGAHLVVDEGGKLNEVGEDKQLLPTCISVSAKTMVGRESGRREVERRMGSGDGEGGVGEVKEEEEVEGEEVKYFPYSEETGGRKKSGKGETTFPYSPPLPVNS